MSADAEFAGLAREYLDHRAERHPDIATGLGDHRFDARLPDPSAQALDDERRTRIFLLLFFFFFIIIFILL